MKKKRRQTVGEELELVDGYYMARDIAQSYKYMREACITDLKQFLELQGYEVAVTMQEQGLFMTIAENNSQLYAIALSPQHVSHLDKVIGTSRLMDYIESIKE